MIYIQYHIMKLIPDIIPSLSGSKGVKATISPVFHSIHTSALLKRIFSTLISPPPRSVISLRQGMLIRFPKITTYKQRYCYDCS